jgi:hypothetical protein
LQYKVQYFNKGAAGNRAPSVRFNTLDPVSDEEVVNKKSNPAGGEYCDDEHDLPEEAEFVLLKDVQYAPDGCDDTDNVNNST